MSETPREAFNRGLERAVEVVETYEEVFISSDYATQETKRLLQHIRVMLKRQMLR